MKPTKIQIKRLIALSIFSVGITGISNCGRVLNCVTGKSCFESKTIEAAATRELFVRAVNSTLDSFRSVLAELGLTQTQQDTVTKDVLSFATSQTNSLELTADSPTYQGSVLERLSLMFQDLMEFTIEKIQQTAPTMDQAEIMNACARFVNDLIANAGLVGILESLPIAEQSELSRDSISGKLDWEVLRAPLERSTFAKFSTPDQQQVLGAALDKFKRRPGDEPLKPQFVKSYRPSDDDKQRNSGKLSELCQVKSSDMGVGHGNKGPSDTPDAIPVPDSSCKGVSLDKAFAFCIYSPIKSAKACSRQIYGSDPTKATHREITVFADRKPVKYTSFGANRVFDCSNESDRKELSKLVWASIQTEVPGCRLPSVKQ